MIDRQFLVERQGRTFALYAGLLDAAHRDGLKRVSTRLLQAGSADNGETWIVSAEVETAKGIFSGIGDASPSNVNRAMVTCLPRMAETRAKARALRDAVNAGALVALEELGDEPAPEPIPIRPPRQQPAEARETAIDVGDDPATANQRRAIGRLGGACPEKISKAEASALIARLQKEHSAG